MPLIEQSLLKDINKPIKLYWTSLFLKEGKANLIVELNLVTSKDRNTIHSSTDLAPNQLFLKKNENYVQKNFQTSLS